MSSDHTRLPSAAPHVLDEDDFIERLDSIIKRDFFPGLKQLRAESCKLETGVAIAQLADSGPSTSSTLDTFLNTHTSEDNACFVALLQIENKRRDDRRMKTWRHSPKSALMFVPDGIDARFATSDKQIIHRNTRFPPSDETCDDAPVTTDESADEYSTPRINGYRLLDPADDTPLPARDKPASKGFTIMPATRGELHVLKAASKSQGMRARRSVQPKGCTSHGTRAAMLSPAAKRLLGRPVSSTRRIGPPTPDKISDRKLRDRYNSPYSRRPY